MCGHAIVAPARSAVERPPRLEDVDLTVHGGEIVGVAGVSGNGQTELAEVIAGVLAPSAGTIEVAGSRVLRATPRRMQGLGVAHIPEDRIGAGLLTTLPLTDSFILPRHASAPFSRLGWLRRRAIRAFVAEQIERFAIRTEGPNVRAGTLSGGNLQKVLLARELAFEPKVLIAAQPTRGLDVSAVEFVHGQFLEMRERGRAVLVVSDDLEEIFALADRIVVMYEGRIVADLEAERTSVADVGLLMAGAQVEAA